MNAAMPVWFVYLFMLTLLSAAMSTSSSQFHTLGTAIGRDFVEKALLAGKQFKYTVGITRIGILLGAVVAAKALATPVATKATTTASTR